MNNSSLIPTPRSWLQYLLRCAMGSSYPSYLSNLGFLNPGGRWKFVNTHKSLNATLLFPSNPCMLFICCSMLFIFSTFHLALSLEWASHINGGAKLYSASKCYPRSIVLLWTSGELSLLSCSLRHSWLWESVDWCNCCHSEIIP